MNKIEADGYALRIRGYHPDDYAFILDAWVKNHKEHSRTSPSLYFEEQKKLIDSLLASEDTRVLCSDEDETTLHGFVCSHKFEYLHYVYIPFKLRRSGFARLLIKAAFNGRYPAHIVCTHAGFGASKRFVTNEHLLLKGKQE